MSDLNKKQFEAVETVNGPVVIIAGPGTGKTKTLVERTVNILVNKKVEAKKREYLEYKKAFDKAIKGMGEYFKEEVKNAKIAYDSLKNDKEAKKYEDACNRKEVLDERISDLEDILKDLYELKVRKGINEEVISKREKEIKDLLKENDEKLDKVKQEVKDLKNHLASDKTNKIATYLNAKKALEKYEKNNNFSSCFIATYKYYGICKSTFNRN